MSSGLIIALELTLVLGVVLGLAVWELLKLRGDRSKPVRATGDVDDTRRVGASDGANVRR